MTGVDPPRIAIVVLAAGASTRLGRPKQLEPFRGTTLLRHAAQVALDAALGPVLVVLGAEAERCTPALGGLDVRVVRFDGWKEGMGATIRTAVAEVSPLAVVGALILTTCDQPGVDATDLQRLAGAYRSSGAAVVGSAYAGAVGIPALFDRSRFAALQALGGEQGARPVLLAEGPRLVSVPCPAAAFDVDAESDTVDMG